MRTRKRDTAEAMPLTTSAKIGQEKDICKVLAYFEYNLASSLDCSKACNVLRNSVTWYISKLEELNLLRFVCKRPDNTTGYMSKHYSADRRLWKRNVPQQLDLFDVPNVGKVMKDLAHAPIRDARSGECNIMALYQKRKEGHNGK